MAPRRGAGPRVGVCDSAGFVRSRLGVHDPRTYGAGATRVTSDEPLIIALSLLAGSLFLLAFARFWVMVLSPHSIQGSDLHMLKWCLEEGRRAWGGEH